MSKIKRNGVTTMAKVMVTMIQYHLLVAIVHIVERVSRMEPMLSYVLKQIFIPFRKACTVSCWTKTRVGVMSAPAKNILSSYILPSKDVTVNCLSLLGCSASADAHQLRLAERTLSIDSAIPELSINRNDVAAYDYLLFLCS